MWFLEWLFLIVISVMKWDSKFKPTQRRLQFVIGEMIDETSCHKVTMQKYMFFTTDDVFWSNCSPFFLEQFSLMYVWYLTSFFLKLANLSVFLIIIIFAFSQFLFGHSDIMRAYIRLSWYLWEVLQFSYNNFHWLPRRSLRIFAIIVIFVKFAVLVGSLWHLVNHSW